MNEFVSFRKTCNFLDNQRELDFCIVLKYSTKNKTEYRTSYNII